MCIYFPHLLTLLLIIVCIGVNISIPHVGEVFLDIAFGGAFYVIVKDEALSIELKSTPLTDIIRIAGAITGI